MNLDDLESVVALGHELSFTRAAERLFVSQSTLSKRLQKLEEQLGIRLFDRSAKRVMPTPAGMRILARLEDITASWAELRSQAWALRCADNPGPEEGLSLNGGRRQTRSAAEADESDGAASPAVATIRFSSYAGHGGSLAAYLAAALGEYQVSVDTLLPAQATARMASDELDAALVFDLPGQPVPEPVPGMQVATVATEPSWILMSAHHPLASHDALTADEITRAGLCWYISPEDHPISPWETALLAQRSPDAVIKTTTQVTLRDIEDGRGVALVSPQVQPTPQRVLVPLSPPVSWHHYLIWRPDRMPQHSTELLLLALRGYYKLRAQRHPRYWQWIRDHPEHFPNIAARSTEAGRAETS